MSTRLTCLTCKQWLSACRCESPVPSEDEARPLIRAKTWTREEVAALLEDEARRRQQVARDMLRRQEAMEREAARHTRRS
jgi:hypothetical protein